MPIIHGVPPSPFVRKVRAVLREKGIDHDLKPIAPIGVSEEFRKLSPLGKIPVYEEGGFVLPDSSAIAAYLERVHPEPALYPADPQDYARALWFEEYADSKLAETVGPVFFERVVKPGLMKQEPDTARVDAALAEAPTTFAYLEEQITGRDYFVADRFSIADIAVATQLAQLVHVGEPPDAGRFPALTRWLENILARPSFKGLLEEDRQMLRL